VTIYLVSDRRQHRRRVVVVGADQARMDGERARKTAMLVSALAVDADRVSRRWRSSLWVAVLLVALAAAAHQGWSANIYTLASDHVSRATP
jgi:hypothetical protein